MKLWVRVSLVFNLLIISIIIYLLGFGKSQVKSFIQKNIIGVRHEQMISMFEACPVSKGAIIFVGNSITEGGHWSELFPDKIILNRGIGGDISEGVLARMDEIVRHEPSKLFLAIGTNDLAIGKEIEEIMDNYKAIIAKVQKSSPATKIYVQSVLPVGKSVLFGHKNDKIPPLNTEIRRMCIEGNLTFVDLDTDFKDEEGYLKEEYTNDNLHLLGQGYLVWKKRIAGYIYE